jgi:glycosyltransferase involved in cell wall biosynthesis
VRFAWDLHHQYLAVGSGVAHKLKVFGARLILHYIRGWDMRTANGVDAFATNSDFVGRRIQKIYRRTSTTIYPPVDIYRFTPCEEKKGYYLAASRLVSYKRIDLIVEAFTRTPNRELVVIGEGPEFERISAKAGPNVRMLGYQPFERLRHYMQHARAFVFAAEEDFGIVPVEAQACGTPVIAYGSGGVIETVIDGKTGVFFASQTVESILGAVETFEHGTWCSAEIRANAERFSARRFRDSFSRFVRQEYAALKRSDGLGSQSIPAVELDQMPDSPLVAFAAGRSRVPPLELGMNIAGGDRQAAVAAFDPAKPAASMVS